jgi:hypothetical protein
MQKPGLLNQTVRSGDHTGFKPLFYNLTIYEFIPQLDCNVIKFVEERVFFTLSLLRHSQRQVSSEDQFFIKFSRVYVLSQDFVAEEILILLTTDTW